jgi:hypothetical protein
MPSKQQPTASRRALKYAALFLVIGGLSWIGVSGEGTLGSVFANMAPTPDVDRANVDGKPAIANYRTWGEDLSEEAVDSGGIEANLDGNASALIASLLQ